MLKITPTPTAIFKISFSIFFIGVFCACNNGTDTPFPVEAGKYAAPVTTPIQFGQPEKLIWSETPANLTSAPASFNYSALPALRFDSSGFQPFPNPPGESVFDWDKLPSAEFRYDSLPEIPYHFKTSVLHAPEITRVNRAVLKNSRSDILYDFGDQLNGVNIYVLFKSRTGFTWIATPKGLFRYDGENLALYTISDLGVVTSMTEDQEGLLWITTRGNGIFFIDFVNGVSGNLSSKQHLPTNFTIRAIIDQENRVWVSFVADQFSIHVSDQPGGVAIIDQSAKTIKLFQHKNGLSCNAPTGILEDTSHNIWIASVQKGLSIVDLKNNRIRYLGKAQGLSTDTLTVVTKDQQGRIWTAGFYGQVNMVDLRKSTIEKLDEQQGLQRAFIGLVVTDHLGNTWIVTDKGIRIIDPSLRSIRTMNKSTGLNSDNVTHLLEDAEHQILIGTSAGLNILSKNAQGIRKAGTAQVSTLLEDSRGRIWIGTVENGIQILDTATGLIRIYDRAHGLSDDLIQYLVEYNGSVLLSTQRGGIEVIDTSLKKIERIGGAQGLTANLTTIEKDLQNNIWVGGISNGVKVLDLQNKKIRTIGKAEGLKDSAIIDIKKDHKGLLWFYSWTGGVGIIDIDNKTVQHIAHSEFTSLTGAREDNLLMHDSRNNTWVMTSTNGIFMISAARDSVTHFTTAQGLLSNSANSLRENQGRIYVGTNEGLNILTPPTLPGDRNWSIESLDKSNGITKIVATYNSDLVLRNGQYLWGDDGITIINNLNELSKDSVMPATYITGFDVFNRSQYFVNDPWKNIESNDTIWNSDGKGRSFFTGRTSKSSIAWLDNNDIHWDSLSPAYQLPVGLRLPYNKNYLQFHFAQMHLGAQDTVWYKYILEGIDQKWSERTTKTASENYPNIGPGHYTFKVASLYNGKWSNPVLYSFTVTPPWWKTWWAYLIYAAVVLGVLRAYIAYRSRRLQRENKVLEEKVSLRTTQLQKSIEELKSTQSQLIQSEKMASLGELTAGIAHEIQNPLNFINNFSEINMELLADMKEEVEKGDTNAAKALADDIAINEEKINHHGRRADSIVKSMLQHSRSNNNAIKEPVNINKLADEYLRLSYHGYRAKDKSFNATMETDFDESLSAEDGGVNIIPQDMGRVILNLITNAFYATAEKKRQHPTGYEPTVSVSTRKFRDKVEVIVKDNGNGVPQKVLDKIFQPFFTTKPTGQGTGLGLSLSYDIVKAHNGELKVNTKEGEGTAFIISIPIIQQ